MHLLVNLLYDVARLGALFWLSGPYPASSPCGIWMLKVLHSTGYDFVQSHSSFHYAEHVI